MFRDREDGAGKLAAVLQEFKSRHPLILAIPRGGRCDGGSFGSRAWWRLGCRFVAQASRTRSARIGDRAISEDGQVHLNRRTVEALGSPTSISSRRSNISCRRLPAESGYFEACGPKRRLLVARSS